MYFNNKLSFFICNEISLEPGNIPELIKGSGLNWFGSTPKLTRPILEKAIWFGTISSQEKLTYVAGFREEIHILSFGDRLGNLFILSLLHRGCSILSSSAKLYIDNSNIKPVYK